MSLGGSVPSWANVAASVAVAPLRTASSTAVARNGIDPMLTSATPVVPLRTAATPDDGPVLGPPVELLERPPRTGHLGNPDLDEQLVGGEGGLEERLEEVDGGDLAPAARTLGHQRAPQGQDRRGEIRGGIAMGQGAAQRAPMTHLRVAHLVGGVGKERDLLLQQRRRLELMVTGQRTDGDLSVPLLYIGAVRDAADVDQHRRGRQPQLHQGQQRVATGEDLGVLAVLGEQRHGLLHRAGAHVLELGRDHDPDSASIPRSAAQARTAFTML